MGMNAVEVKVMPESIDTNLEELKQEINALKLIQIISLKQKMNQKAEEQTQA